MVQHFLVSLFIVLINRIFKSFLFIFLLIFCKTLIIAVEICLIPVVILSSTLKRILNIVLVHQRIKMPRVHFRIWGKFGTYLTSLIANEWVNISLILKSYVIFHLIINVALPKLISSIYLPKIITFLLIVYRGQSVGKTVPKVRKVV